MTSPATVSLVAASSASERDACSIVRGEAVGEVPAEAGADVAERPVQAFDPSQSGFRRAFGHDIRHVGALPQQHIPEPDPIHAPGIEIVEPGSVQPVEGLGSGPGAAVADPGLGVLGDVLLLALDDPVVEAFGPFGRARESVAALDVLPVAQQLRDPARCEVVAGGPDHGFDERVADQAAVTIVVLGHPGRARGDDERRIRDDAVEPLAGDGFIEAPESQLDTLDAVEREVHARERQRALRDVGRDDPVGESRRVHRLDAAARAEVEHAPRGRRQHQPGERHRRAADAEHVLLAERAADRELAEVREDPPLAALPARR